MLNLLDVLEVKSIVLNKEDGKYRAEYLGRVVYEKSSNAMWLFDSSGETYSIILPGLRIHGEDCFSPGDLTNILKSYNLRSEHIKEFREHISKQRVEIKEHLATIKNLTEVPNTNLISIFRAKDRLDSTIVLSKVSGWCYSHNDPYYVITVNLDSTCLKLYYNNERERKADIDSFESNFTTGKGKS